MRVPSAAYPLLIVAACLVSAEAQTATCLDVADEPHHQLLFQNQDARVFLLELPRLASTKPHCNAHPYLYIVTGQGRSSNTLEGQVAITPDWNGPEARFVYSRTQRVIRNESINPYRELIVETMHGLQYNFLDGSYDGDLFPGDLGDAKPTWTVSFSRGALTASKTQLAPGAELSVSRPNHVLLALTDLELRKQGADGSDQTVQLSAQEVKILHGGSEFKLINSGHQTAKFILVEF